MAKTILWKWTFCFESHTYEHIFMKICMYTKILHVFFWFFFFRAQANEWDREKENERDGHKRNVKFVVWEYTGIEHCWRNKIIEIDKSGSRIYPLIFLKKKNRFGPDISLIMIRTKQIKIHIMRHRNTDSLRREGEEKKNPNWGLISQCIYFCIVLVLILVRRLKLTRTKTKSNRHLMRIWPRVVSFICV